MIKNELNVYSAGFLQRWTCQALNRHVLPYGQIDKSKQVQNEDFQVAYVL